MKNDIVMITNILVHLYPIEGVYGSRASLYGEAKRDGIITNDEYTEASKFYGKLWTYSGD